MECLRSLRKSGLAANLSPLLPFGCRPSSSSYQYDTFIMAVDWGSWDIAGDLTSGVRDPAPSSSSLGSAFLTAPSSCCSAVMAAPTARFLHDTCPNQYAFAVSMASLADITARLPYSARRNCAQCKPILQL